MCVVEVWGEACGCANVSKCSLLYVGVCAVRK